MENILVTGITGRSGRWFYKAILDNESTLLECNILFVVRNRESADTLLTDKKFYVHIADIDNQADMERIMKKQKSTTLLHIAGISHSLSLVKAAVNCGVRRLILVHTTGIFSKFKEAGKHYRQIEEVIYQMIEGKDISLSILRPTMIYGTLDDKNISQFIRMVDKLRLFPVVKKGTFALQPVHHQDLGKAYYQVLINPDVTRNKNYNLSGGTVVNLIDILRHISQLLNKKTVFVSVPFWIAYSASVLLYGITFSKVDYREKVQRLIEPRAFSHDDATNDFGYSPINFFDGLKCEVDEYVLTK